MELKILSLVLPVKISNFENRLRNIKKMQQNISLRELQQLFEYKNNHKNLIKLIL